MKISICGSMHFAKEMLEIKNKLEEMGHFAFVPSDIDDCVKNPELSMDMEHCLKTNVQKECFDSVAKNDAILVLNYDREGIKNYIGGNVFLEMGFTHVLNKKIFLYNPIPKINYEDEIKTIGPIILNGNLDLIE